MAAARAAKRPEARVSAPGRTEGARRPARAGRVEAVDRGAAAYNALPRIEQKVLRRTVRMGRRLDSREQAAMAVALARFQRGQTWYRLFWPMFLPGMVVSVVVASRMHVAMVGVVLALGAQAAWGWIALRRVEKVNRRFLA